MRKTIWGGAALLAALVATWIPTRGQEAPRRTVWDGVYTAEQAKLGAETYASRCAECHGADMHGAPGLPGVAGPEFQFGWNGKTVGELFDYMSSTMPPTQPGGLSAPQYAGILAAILQANEFPAGSAELPADKEALRAIKILRQKP
jgi:mono/diheme cytochrome c family protein